MFLFAMVLVFSSVEAATISYEPGEVSVSVEAGGSGTFPFSVSLQDSADLRSYAQLSLEASGLPSGWTVTGGERAFVTPGSGMSLQMTLSVPSGTAGGTYSGTIIARVASATESVDTGRGARVTVTVPGKTGCSSAPEFGAVSSSISSIKTRNNKTVSVSFTGSLREGEGCQNSRTWYTVEDEYGEGNTSASFTAGQGGDFSIAIPLVASRKGSDKDGRLYTITFHADGEGGSAESRPVAIRVTHDNGNN